MNIHTKAKNRTKPKATDKDDKSEINPMTTGPIKNPPIAKVFMMASPPESGNPGYLAALAYKIGAPQETPSPIRPKPAIAVQVKGRNIVIKRPPKANAAP